LPKVDATVGSSIRSTVTGSRVYPYTLLEEAYPGNMANSSLRASTSNNAAPTADAVNFALKSERPEPLIAG